MPESRACAQREITFRTRAANSADSRVKRSEVAAAGALAREALADDNVDEEEEEEEDEDGSPVAPLLSRASPAASSSAGCCASNADTNSRRVVWDGAARIESNAARHARTGAPIVALSSFTNAFKSVTRGNIENTRTICAQ